MAWPIVFGSEADVAGLVPALVMEAERVAAGLRVLLVEAIFRREAANVLASDGGGALALVRDRPDLEAGLAQMIFIARS